MIMQITYLFLVAIFFILLLRATAKILNLIQRKPRHCATLPPGPKRKPIVGNLFDVPAKNAWLVYQQWALTYGDVLYLEFFHRPVIIINSDKAAYELCDERSAIYSDRPASPMISLMGWDVWNFGFMRYGTEWRKYRRAFHQYFGPAAIPDYEHVQLRAVHNFLKRLLVSPDLFLDHIQSLATITILSVTYGEDSVHSHDGSTAGFVDLAQIAVRDSSEAFLPGKYWIDFIPFLRFVPEWIPGASFRRKAKVCKHQMEAVIELPFAAVKRSMDDNATSMSMAASMLANIAERSSLDEERFIKNVTAVSHGAGFDTVRDGVVSKCVPDYSYRIVQAEARKELDRIIGPDRLPTFHDRDKLVYIDAIVKEVLRWRPIVPLGMAHRVTQDDIYEGHLIPKDSVIILNAWAILHNPDMYPDPDMFKPERFIKDGKLDREVKDPSAAFGYGRRICPGQYFSLATLFIVIASVLHTYHIGTPIDDDAQTILSDGDREQSNGFSIVPKPFQSMVQPRSAIAEQLIRELEIN